VGVFISKVSGLGLEFGRGGGGYLLVPEGVSIKEHPCIGFVVLRRHLGDLPSSRGGEGEEEPAREHVRAVERQDALQIVDGNVVHTGAPGSHTDVEVERRVPGGAGLFWWL